MISAHAYSIFERAIHDYHVFDDIDQALDNPYAVAELDHLLYRKNWIDTVQWHLEDLIRDPAINPVVALQIKRRIDSSNQERTDMVEFIDSHFLNIYTNVTIQPTATLNTESPAWAIDRLSILALKIYHMSGEATRGDAGADHRQKAQSKLDILLVQKQDLSAAIDQLMVDIANGEKYMKVYRQMKMYNDDSLNPVLYQKKNA